MIWCRGSITDAISYKEWRAEAVDVETPISAVRVKAYLSTPQSTTQSQTEVVMEIDKDNGDKPGDMVTSVSRPISVVTQTDNWITFDTNPAPTLAPGRYWIVMKLVQTQQVNLFNDIVQMHYVTVDKSSAGNDHTAQMLLNVDEKTGLATASQWTPLTFDREYDIVLTTSK